jgi:hypothetical protein
MWIDLKPTPRDGQGWGKETKKAKKTTNNHQKLGNAGSPFSFQIYHEFYLRDNEMVDVEQLR